MRRPNWALPVLLWILTGVLVGVLVIMAPALHDRTNGIPVDPMKLWGGGQLLPGIIATLLAAETNMLRTHTGGPPARAIIGGIGMLVIASSAFWWGDIVASPSYDQAFVTDWSPVVYLFGLFVVGSCVVISSR